MGYVKKLIIIYTLTPLENLGKKCQRSIIPLKSEVIINELIHRLKFYFMSATF